ncbi:uncharacterized protein LOC111041833 [Myzus persicae]|uniref:uncharacterized protein LOC111041833 n=1 Tax=Myzus persicae TaxID=13164 RepID=UPI000B931978|nr:uncharacterized protein LOC111041833 [Myzus persicae]
MGRKLSGCAYQKLSTIKKDGVKKSMNNNMKLDLMFQGVQQIDTVHTVHTVASEIIDNIGHSSNEFIDSVKSSPLIDQSSVKCKSIKEDHVGNEVKSVNVPLIDQSSVKCKSIKEDHGGNEGIRTSCSSVTNDNYLLNILLATYYVAASTEGFETQIANEVNILQTPSSSDMPDDDPALWILNEVTRDFICRNGFNQNLDNDFSQSKTQYQYIRQGKFRPHNRYLSKDLFKTALINGKTCQRDYLCYSTGNIQIKLILMKIQLCIKPVHLK